MLFFKFISLRILFILLTSCLVGGWLIFIVLLKGFYTANFIFQTFISKTFISKAKTSISKTFIYHHDYSTPEKRNFYARFVRWIEWGTIKRLNGFSNGVMCTKWFASKSELDRNTQHRRLSLFKTAVLYTLGYILQPHMLIFAILYACILSWLFFISLFVRVFFIFVFWPYQFYKYWFLDDIEDLRTLGEGEMLRTFPYYFLLGRTFLNPALFELDKFKEENPDWETYWYLGDDDPRIQELFALERRCGFWGNESTSYYVGSIVSLITIIDPYYSSFRVLYLILNRIWGPKPTKPTSVISWLRANLFTLIFYRLCSFLVGLPFRVVRCSVHFISLARLGKFDPSQLPDYFFKITIWTSAPLGELRPNNLRLYKTADSKLNFNPEQVWHNPTPY